MSTKAERVLSRVRLELKDEFEPYFWLDSELLAYIDEGQTEFCRQGQRLIDSRTPKVCHLDYKSGANEIPLHPSIYKILSIVREDSNGVYHKVRMATQENFLEMFPIRPSDYGHNTADAAQSLTSASDRFDVFVDYDEGYLRLSSPAISDGRLRLQVERLPLKRIEDCDVELEIRREYEPAVIAWAVFRAWSKQDAETFDPTGANRALALFEDHANRARVEQKRRTSQPGTVKYGGL